MADTKSGIIEGTWDEISAHASEFNGHRLRLMIIPDDIEPHTNERLPALNEWLNLSRPRVTTDVDDSRASIYTEDQGRG